MDEKSLMEWSPYTSLTYSVLDKARLDAVAKFGTGEPKNFVIPTRLGKNARYEEWMKELMAVPPVQKPLLSHKPLADIDPPHWRAEYQGTWAPDQEPYDYIDPKTGEPRSKNIKGRSADRLFMDELGDSMALMQMLSNDEVMKMALLSERDAKRPGGSASSAAITHATRIAGMNIASPATYPTAPPDHETSRETMRRLVDKLTARCARLESARDEAATRCRKLEVENHLMQEAMSMLSTRMNDLESRLNERG